MPFGPKKDACPIGSNLRRAVVLAVEVADARFREASCGSVRLCPTFSARVNRPFGTTWCVLLACDPKNSDLFSTCLLASHFPKLPGCAEPCLWD